MWMARKIAAADPSTLDAAFKAQAQRTAWGNRISSHVRPVGKGMPIRKAAGAIRHTVTKIFAGKGQPTPNSLIGAATNARAETAAATAISMMLRRWRYAPRISRRL